ncbi:MAG: helix-turn-helix domain-containing protein, partial [Hydrogenophaga sp.]
EPGDFGAPSAADEPPAGTPTPPAANQAPSDDPPTEAPDDIPTDLQSYLDEQERQVLVRALREADFNRTAAAQRLGLNLRQMRYRIQRLGIVMPGDDDA